MKTIDDMPIMLAIRLYYEKHHALRHGDMLKLIDLKNQYPGIFDVNKDVQLREMIENFKKLEASAYYQDLCREKRRKQLTVIEGNVVVSDKV